MALEQNQLGPYVDNVLLNNYDLIAEGNEEPEYGTQNYVGDLVTLSPYKAVLLYDHYNPDRSASFRAQVINTRTGTWQEGDMFEVGSTTDWWDYTLQTGIRLSSNGVAMGAQQVSTDRVLTLGVGKGEAGQGEAIDENALLVVLDFAGSDMTTHPAFTLPAWQPPTGSPSVSSHARRLYALSDGTYLVVGYPTFADDEPLMLTHVRVEEDGTVTQLEHQQFLVAAGTTDSFMFGETERAESLTLGDHLFIIVPDPTNNRIPQLVTLWDGQSLQYTPVVNLAQQPLANSRGFLWTALDATTALVAIYLRNPDYSRFWRLFTLTEAGQLTELASTNWPQTVQDREGWGHWTDPRRDHSVAVGEVDKGIFAGAGNKMVKIDDRTIAVIAMIGNASWDDNEIGVWLYDWQADQHVGWVLLKGNYKQDVEDPDVPLLDDDIFLRATQPGGGGLLVAQTEYYDIRTDPAAPSAFVDSIYLGLLLSIPDTAISGGPRGDGRRFVGA